MARLFDITTTRDTATVEAGKAERLVFTVTNTTTRPQRGALRPKALDSAQPGWLQLAGDAERDFPPGFTHQVEVAVQPPAGTPPGRCRVRLDVVSVANPDDDFTEGPPVGVTVAPGAQPEPRKGLPWWVWAVVALVVVVLIAVTVLLLRRGDEPGTPPPPTEPAAAVVPADLLGRDYEEARSALEKLGFATTRRDDLGCAGKVVAASPAPGASAAAGAKVELAVGVLPYGPSTCRQGFVWREAFSGDAVCVTPESRSRAQADNAQHPNRVERVLAGAKEIEDVQRSNPQAAAVPKGDIAALTRLDRRFIPIGALLYVDRCKPGFFERLAGPTDFVCVPRATQTETQVENRDADSRLACSTRR